MSHVLTIATAGRTPQQLHDHRHEHYPRVDYIELQRLLDMSLLDYDAYAHSLVGRVASYVETQVRSDLYLALLSLIEQRRHDLVFMMSERVAIPFTSLYRVLPRRRPIVAMFQCWSPRQEFVTTRLNLFASMAAIIVHCHSMKQHLTRLQAPPDRIHVIPYSVDQHFFRPQPRREPVGRYIFAVGEPRSRNYDGLFRAVQPLATRLVVAASGRWYSRGTSTLAHATVPPNVTVGGQYEQAELRRMYAECAFVVVPIKDQVYSAGATAILEAMCMGKAVIVTRSQGIADYVKDGETAIVVDQDDEVSLRDAIEYLLAHPAEACRLGQNGRQWVEDELNLDRYVLRITELIESLGFATRRLPVGASVG